MTWEPVAIAAGAFLLVRLLVYARSVCRSKRRHWREQEEWQRQFARGLTSQNFHEWLSSPRERPRNWEGGEPRK